MLLTCVQDKEDDLKVGVKSTALRFGDSTKEWINGFGIASISSLALCGYNAGIGMCSIFCTCNSVLTIGLIMDLILELVFLFFCICNFLLNVLGLKSFLFWGKIVEQGGHIMHF